MAVAGLCAFLGLFVFRLSREADQQAAEKAEVAREVEHARAVDAWMGDTSANAQVPAVASWPMPTSYRAKRIWVVSRMLVARAVWEREVMKRHGLKTYDPPAAWGKPAGWANMRAHPEVAAFLESRAAVIAEFEKTSAAWMEERIGAMARETGLPADDIRGMFPPDFATVGLDHARTVAAMVETHRHLVRIDPRVHHGGGSELLWDSEADLSRLEELLDKQNEAARLSSQAAQQRRRKESGAFAFVIE